MLVLACIGHWTASLLYVVPVAAILGALGIQHIRERRTGVHRATRTPERFDELDHELALGDLGAMPEDRPARVG